MTWTSEPHVLVVPEDPTEYLDVEHPPTCPQFLETEVIWTKDDAYACQVEWHLTNAGADAFFHRPGELGDTYSTEVGPGQYEIASYVEVIQGPESREYNAGLALYDGPEFPDVEDLIAVDCE